MEEEGELKREGEEEGREEEERGESGVQMTPANRKDEEESPEVSRDNDAVVAQESDEVADDNDAVVAQDEGEKAEALSASDELKANKDEVEDSTSNSSSSQPPSKETGDYMRAQLHRLHKRLLNLTAPLRPQYGEYRNLSTTLSLVSTVNIDYTVGHVTSDEEIFLPDSCHPFLYR